MLLQVIVEERDLEEVTKFLNSEGRNKPKETLKYELFPELRVFKRPVKVFVTYDQYIILKDLQESL